MAQATSSTRRAAGTAPSQWAAFTRRRTFLPQEHGGWVLFLIPLLTGAVAGGIRGERVAPLLAFGLAALALFMARQPLDLALKSWRGARPRYDLPALAAWLAIDGAVALCAGVYLLWATRLWGLVAIAAASLFFMGLQLWALATRLYRTAWVEVITTAGLGLGAAGAYYVARGAWSQEALGLWCLVALQGMGGVLYSRWRLRRRRLAAQGKPYTQTEARRPVLFHFGLALVTAAGLALARWVPWAAVPLYAVLLLRTAWGTRGAARPDPSALAIGVGEGIATLVSAAWLALAFLL